MVTAEEGDEAIRLFQDLLQSGKSIDLSMMDLTISDGMGGKEAAAEIHKIDSNALVAISRGYSNDPNVDNFKE